MASRSGEGRDEDGSEILVSEEIEPHESWDLSAIGLRLTDPDLPYVDFERLCLMLGGIHGAVRFAIGDAIRLGEELYGEEAHQALELLGLSEAGRMEYVRVALQVPRSRRRSDLSWSHHRAVAALPPAEQKTWLRRAVEEQLSHHQLRDELRNGAEPVAATKCRCCGRAL
jgi:hypothetical protein